MKLIFFFCIAALMSRNAFSQSRMDNWVFGDSIGMNFTGGIVTKFETAITSFEACATISDESGNLLFYTDGENVWDRNHHIMPNGDSLEIGRVSTGWDGSSITQGVVIVPCPDNPTNYYIIYISEPLTPYLGYLGIKYSVVDMTQNGGFGDVVEKNIQLITDIHLYEKMQAVKHGNGRDWWLVLIASNQDWVENDTVKFVKYLINPEGITGPFYQDHADLKHLSDGIYDLGEMKFNQSGSMIAISKGKDADLYDFDRCTGIFFNYLNIDTVNVFDGSYGIEFSPDGRMFYVSSWGGLQHSKLIQYCVKCPGDINETKKIIYLGQWNNMDLGQLQLSIDGKIYLTGYPTVIGTLDQLKHALYVINEPNVEGINCNLDTLTIDFDFGSINYTLPNMPNYSLGPLVGSGCDTLLSISNIHPQAGIKIYPNPAANEIYISGNTAYSTAQIKLHIYNLLGEEVFSMEKIPFNSAINISSLQNGLYAVQLENGKEVLFNGEIEIIK